MQKINSALISVYNKEGLEPILKELSNLNVAIYSTGGTQNFIEEKGFEVTAVESLTEYPSILGGRVKTLHPKVFGGILSRRNIEGDTSQLAEYEIPEIDLVIVDLYPFEETVANTNEESEIIEKIDIGGISLIRAAAKNYKDVVIIPSMSEYPDLLEILTSKQGFTNVEDRKVLAAKAFNISSHYDTAIHNYFDPESTSFKQSLSSSRALRYGENPHQTGKFFGNLEQLFEQLNGKELSYNNLLDLDAAINLISEFNDCDPTFAILKHNNACGLATRSSLKQAYDDALAGDPISAFGGILISNKEIDVATAEQINKLFCEVVVAPAFNDEALSILKSKKNRIVLIQKSIELPDYQFRSALHGVLWQEKDLRTDPVSEFKTVTKKSASKSEAEDMFFANKLVKHTKSNTIVLAKENQLLSSGTGQTSRVDALKQAIAKAKGFGFDLDGAVMASDAFFPFPDCVEIASQEGIAAVIQPGGSIKDQLSIDCCDENNMAMVFTGHRHFKH